MSDALTAVVEFAIAAYTRLEPSQVDAELVTLRERAILAVEREADRVFASGGGTLEAVA